jgi:ribosomal-protein-alanine N-acetyltransferase
MSLVRRATPADADGLAAIHAASFDRPWPAADFLRWMANDAASLWLAERAGEIAAFGLATIVIDEAELLTLACAPHLRGQGLGCDVFSALDADAARRGATEWRLDVARGNTSARRLYDRLGFFEIGVRKGYYPTSNGADDALLMARKAGGATSS